ncbi:MAG: deoxyribose-phosphate aldolase [Thermoprotei archaeon]|nr:MAG: deoxyribose-phosphate aldolase [Thermoprotei archaeon]RLF00982.1 MAG: deoxyribose-phosphate aldolase [Thermoprotei archaeon]HDI74864.1 deoxyribose-phosphate aldolase [Thermoprotei archaeon]
MSLSEFVKKIDHTVLKPNARLDDIINECRKSMEIGFAAFVAPPVYIKQVSEILASSDVKPCTVVGFPLGYSLTEVKLAELEQATARGAEEVDVVMNISFLRSGLIDDLKRELTALVEAAHSSGVIIKVIIQTDYLNDEEKAEACRLLIEAGADYVKTCTGFGPGRATIHDVALLKKVSEGKIKVKAAGGIRHAEDALTFIRAGADRIGTSSGVIIAEEYKRLIEATEA